MPACLDLPQSRAGRAKGAANSSAGLILSSQIDGNASLTRFFINVLPALCRRGWPGWAGLMTTYFFDLHEGVPEAEACSVDREGRRFDSAEAALAYACHSLRFFVSQRALEGVIPLGGQIVIRTDAGRYRAIAFADALQMR
jgi:hypothetical protein